LTALDDLAAGLRYVNRQRGAGTACCSTTSSAGAASTR
jgi:molybdate-binding protein